MLLIKKKNILKRRLSLFIIKVSKFEIIFVYDDKDRRDIKYIKSLIL